MAGMNGGGLRFNMLGPLEAWSGGVRLELGGPIQRRVLATLLLDAGHMLPVPRLIEAAWGEDPPATGAHQIRKSVANLRSRIPEGGQVLVTDGPGYTAVVTPTQLDLHEFTGWLDQGKELAASGRLREAAEALGAGLALWRGPALSGLDGPVIETATVLLGERHMAAVERYFELRLSLGETAELISELRGYVGRFPLRETLCGQLLLALYRSGRRAEALDEYGKVRERLVEKLGVDPGPALGRLYENMLREHPSLAAPAPIEPPTAAPADPPRNLPYDLADFVGRERELSQITASVRKRGQHTRIVALDGMGGSGKTSLAVRAAHRLADEFPDGQLYIDLRGHTPYEQPVTTATALEILLRAARVPEERIPDDLPGRAAVWQSELSGKRMLILLDNAADVTVVIGLLPRSPDCLVIVTSRARLVDLDGAEWISIGVMAPEESTSLIAEVLGAERTAAEQSETAELVRLCGHLPLALRIAAARLRNRPSWSLRYMVERLRDETYKLDELNSGERGVATTLRLSYQGLGADCRSLFLLLSVHPGRAVDVFSAAAMLGLDVRETEDRLERLLDVHLLQQPDVGLYAYHNLVRSFALSLYDRMPRKNGPALAGRLVDYYLAASEAACAVLFPGRGERPTGLPRSAASLPSFRQADDAQAWFAREDVTLVSVIDLAERESLDRHVVFLVRNLAFYLNLRGSLHEFRRVSRTAVAAARRIGEAGLLSICLSNLSVACWKLGLHEEGVSAAREGRDLAVVAEDRPTQAHSEGALGLHESMRGQFDQALGHLEAAVALERELGTPCAEAESLTVLSALYEQWGRYAEASGSARRAITLARQAGRHETELVALTDLALAQVGMGELAAAESSLVEARTLYDERTDPGQAAVTLALSAILASQRGDSEACGEYTDQAQTLVERSASPLRRAKVTNMLGRLFGACGDHDKALSLHVQACEVASAIGYRMEEAHALRGMAMATRALGDELTAGTHWAAAEGLFTALGVPESRRRAPEFSGPRGSLLDDGRALVLGERVVAVAVVVDGAEEGDDSNGGDQSGEPASHGVSLSGRVCW
ncbi:tetratricopeptide repeat protein [Micromonospora sp. C51]|uniref:AfsR/SARP family transcriptional regulator n=1 Tax=Micromonospora sp. C51 TaxID=2824879 RepID=UPI001B36CFA7|nr:BTAD domain-containing putative transcriptional regulator [Micromonospora sp. C51]MBQ1050208.1 tetratricopeptide repeat protein [Micromonospora sp. C51]